jgi:HlyD family secretion protein
MVELHRVNRMHRNYFLIIVGVSLFCLFLIFYSFWREIKTPVAEVKINPTYAPFRSSISGVGIVEPSSENIAIGSPLQRIVRKVYVASGEKVKKGSLLFCLENRDLKASLKAQEAAYNTALAKLQRLEALPREEDLQAAAAAANSAKAELETAKKQYDMILDLPDPRAISEQEKLLRQARYEQAKAKAQEAAAKLEKVKGGAWQPDLQIARQEVDLAKANIDQIKAKLIETIVRSPIDGTILQVNIHEGEMPSQQNPLLILGNINEKNLRVSINQLDVPKFNPKAPAVAFLQGDSKIPYPLEFLYVEPILVSKKNLTHIITETVDTRVLRIIYRIKNNDPNLYVGEQMDVYIESGYKE